MLFAAAYAPPFRASIVLPVLKRRMTAMSVYAAAGPDDRPVAVGRRVERRGERPVLGGERAVLERGRAGGAAGGRTSHRHGRRATLSFTRRRDRRRPRCDSRDEPAAVHRRDGRTAAGPRHDTP